MSFNFIRAIETNFHWSFFIPILLCIKIWYVLSNDIEDEFCRLVTML